MSIRFYFQSSDHNSQRREFRDLNVSGCIPHWRLKALGFKCLSCSWVIRLFSLTYFYNALPDSRKKTIDESLIFSPAVSQGESRLLAIFYPELRLNSDNEKIGLSNVKFKICAFRINPLGCRQTIHLCG